MYTAIVSCGANSEIQLHVVVMKAMRVRKVVTHVKWMVLLSFTETVARLYLEAISGCKTSGMWATQDRQLRPITS